MKYDTTKELTRGAKRTFGAFKDGMFTLLAQKPFEEITVNEICDLTSYPRATFYNYFDDKYDLLNYCWKWIEKEIQLDEFDQMDPNESLYIFFDRICDLCEDNIDLIHKILQNNHEANYMFSSFRTYVNTQMWTIFDKCHTSEQYKIPKGIIAEHYNNTLLLILEWYNLKEHVCTREDAHEYLRYLLGNL